MRDPGVSPQDAGGGLELITPSEAGALLAVSRPTVVRWAAQGLLSDVRVGTHHRFRKDEVLALRERRLVEAEQAAARARSRRSRVEAAGVDLESAPTPREMLAAGRALRSGDRGVGDAVLVRALRASARGAAETVGSE